MELERNLVFGILSKAFRGGNEACPVIRSVVLGSQIRSVVWVLGDTKELPENRRITGPCSLFIGAPFWMAL